MNRRNAVQLAVAAVGAPLFGGRPDVKIGLNAYSFNQPLRDGAMTLSDVVDFCSQHGIEALDATGYYFPGYPAVAPDDYLFALKRRSFASGIVVSGTGVRNDFAVADEAARRRDLQMVKDWIAVAAKLGAGIIRVFTGLRVPEGHRFESVLEWMVPLFKECAAHGRARGVIVGLQNHHDFAKTAAETIRIVKAVDSDWFRVILDVGSLRMADPYEEIERLIPYAASWQLKENVFYGTKETPVDLPRLKGIIDKAGYRGYLPIETLGAGDPRVKVPRFLAQVREVFG
ncbi:MAG: sugar phosphate isomerase/epimerase family protein [Bryobacteraceae bacterium]|nr:sugar phosphate isomerase/epimerase family protein [Bryobacteraceae bacterium]